MASLSRILIVDYSPVAHNATRAALDLLERDAIIVNIQAGSAALAEIERGDVDMLVCGYDLVDMQAPDLARRVHRLQNDLPVVLLAGRGDPVIEPETVTDGPFYPLVRAGSADRFLQVMQALLDGMDPEDGPVNGLQGVALGPIPQVDIGALSDRMAGILTDVGAMAAVLADREGRILQETGAVGYLNRDRLMDTLAPMFANMVRIGPLVGGGRPQAMHFYNGEEFDIFALAIGLHHFICLIFEGSAGSRAFGAVTMFGRRAVQDMLQIIGDPAFTLQITSEHVPAKHAAAQETPAAGARTRKPAKRRTQEIKLEDVAVDRDEAYEPPPPEVLEPLPEDTDLEAMLANLDKVDAASLDDLFDPDDLAKIAAKKLAGERLSFEEAQQMGVIDQE
ncbi:MAG: response regulator [Anaerolineae bacterium]|nr:response regulator [Anaerolineae bacterium]